MITAIDKNTALVLIDLQKGIINRKTAHPVQGVLDKSNLLLENFHKAGLPVVIVNVIPARRTGLVLRKDFNRSPVATAPDFADIVDELQTQPGDLFVTKGTWNAFYNTSLHDALQQRGVTGIVLGGISTSIGVEGTARAAGELGYNISFATDAMTDTNMEAHQHSLRNIFPRLGEAGTAEDIIRKLPGRS